MEKNMTKAKSNTISIQEIVQKIEKGLKQQNKAWMDIAEAFYTAYEQYGSDSDAFKKVLKLTFFSHSKAMKLVSIYGDKRLKENADVFDEVHSWTTLYDVTTLDDNQFEALLDENQNAKENGKTYRGVTAGMVSRAKRNFEPAKKDDYTPVFTIRVDENALAAMEFTGSNYEDLVELVRKIQDTVPYVRVDAVDKFSRADSSYWDKIHKRMQVELRRELDNAIDHYKAQSREWQNWKDLPNKQKKSKPKPRIGNWADKDELLAHFETEPHEVFKVLDPETTFGSQQRLYERAMKEVETRKAKVWKRFNKTINDPFAHAGRLGEVGDGVSVSSPNDGAATTEDEDQVIKEALLAAA